VAIPSKEQRLSDIKIRRSHAMPHDKARAAAEKMAKLLKKEFALDYEWAEDEKDVLVFERPGVNGELTVAPKHVEMEVKLGFLLKMMKPTIERHIHDHLDEIFAEHEKAKPKKA
jgi:putative polyhydroxyalkanoate system protein